MRTLGWILIVIAVVFWSLWGLNTYWCAKDIDSYINRAQVAANADRMLGYMLTLRTNMEERGMTKGHYALVFKEPDNDLSLYYQAVNDVISRLETIKDIPSDSVVYQTAMDDLRGIIREFENPAGNFIWTKYWLMIVFSFICLFCGVAILIAHNSY